MDNDRILLEEFITNHTTDAARLVEQLKVEQISSFINNLSIDLSVMLLKEMDMFMATRCLEEIETEKSAKIIEKFPTSIASSFLRKIQKEKEEQILNKMEPKISESLSQMLHHMENTAGALMNPQVPTILENLNVKEAFDIVKKSKQQSYEYIYILDGDRKLIGIVKLEDLIIAEPKEQIASIMDKEVPYLYSEVEIQKTLDHPGWLELNALPVIDRSGVFIGELSQSVIRKMDINKKRKVPQHAIAAGNALGELYKLGLSGLLYSTSVKNKANE